MPKRQQLKTVLIIGSGPIVIGQACEFDYAGTQALRSLREDGITTVLINSNPATIMTDPTMADHVYLKPLTTKSIIEILKQHDVDAVLPTMGGQTALNLCIQKSSFVWFVCPTNILPRLLLLKQLFYTSDLKNAHKFQSSAYSGEFFQDQDELVQ